MKKIFDLSKYIFYFFFSKVVFISIYYFKLKKINLFYTKRAGYGDFLFFCQELQKKLDKNNRIFCYTKIQYEVAKFFYNKNQIAKSFILIPSYVHNPIYITKEFLLKNINFEPTEITRPAPDNPNFEVPLSEWWSGTDDSIRFLNNRIENSKISKRLKKICKAKTLCLFVKNYSHIKNDNLNFQVRQTKDLKKIYKLIDFLSLKNLNIVILGKKNDNFIKTFPNDLKKKHKNLFLFKDLSDKYSISDQAYIALNSIGYVGNMSGPTSFFGMLNKRGIIIDAVSFYSDVCFNNFLFIYKKIYNKKHKTLQNFIWQHYYDPNKFEVTENTYEEIIENVEKIFLEKRI